MFLSGTFLKVIESTQIVLEYWTSRGVPPSHANLLVSYYPCSTFMCTKPPPIWSWILRLWLPTLHLLWCGIFSHLTQYLTSSILVAAISMYSGLVSCQTHFFLYLNSLHFLLPDLTLSCETDISKGLCIILPIYGWLLPGEEGNHFPCSGLWRVIDELLTVQCMLLLVQCPLVPWVHVKKLMDVCSTARHGLSGKDYT